MVNPSKTANELVESIDEATKEAYTEWENPERLSKLLIDLSVFKSGLGFYVADTQRAVKEYKGRLVFEREKKKLSYVESGDSATVADSKKIVDTENIRELLDKSEYEYQLLKLKHGDTGDVADAIRSRLSLIKQDLREVPNA